MKTDFVFFENNHAVETINSMFSKSRMPHAVLITGARGVGKKTFALRLAASILCESKSQKPCGICESCVAALSSANHDIIVYEGVGTRSFHIEEIRAIIDDAYMAPRKYDKKVYVLLNCETMTVSAQNALLKMLEEPPQSAVFILTCETSELLLETVRSRVVEIPLLPVSDEACIAALKKYVVGKTEDEYKNAVLKSSGNIGLGIKLLSDDNYKKISDCAANAVDALCRENEFDFLKQFSDYEKNKEQLVLLLSEIELILRDAVTQKAMPGISLLSGCNVSEIKLKITNKKALACIDAISDAVKASLLNVNNALFQTQTVSAVYNAFTAI